MPINSRSKGRRYELSIVNRFKRHGFDTHRNDQCAQDHGKADISAESPTGLRLHIECKHTTTLPGARVLAAYQQAVDGAEDGAIPCAYFHLHGTSRDLVVLDSADFESLLLWGEKS